MSLKEILGHPFLSVKKLIRARTELSKFAELAKMTDISNQLLEKLN